MENNIPLADRMKSYEKQSRSLIDPTHYIIIRVDGKAFHTYTKNMQKPWDDGLVDNMVETTKYLCENVPTCVFGYTQSDEISLILKPSPQPYFNGQVQKIVSIVASMATAKFTQSRIVTEYKNVVYQEDCDVSSIAIRDFIEGVDLAHFDARILGIELQNEVVRYFIWRQRDAIRNSIQMLASYYFTQKEMHKLNTDILRGMISARVCDGFTAWEDIDISKQRGTGVLKHTELWQRNDNPLAPYTGTYIKDVTNEGGETCCTDTMKKQGFYTRKKWKIDLNIPIFEENWDYIFKIL